jgi:uncharacterized protein (DUF924 family)
MGELEVATETPPTPTWFIVLVCFECQTIDLFPRSNYRRTPRAYRDAFRQYAIAGGFTLAPPLEES